MAKTRPGWHTWGFVSLFWVLLWSALPAGAHTSVERLLRVAPNGTTIGAEGFPRGFWPRGAPGYFDNANIYLIPPNGPVDKVIRPDDKIAHPAQRTSNYTTANPPLKAAPGDMIVLQYQENGHTTLPNAQVNKTLNRGTVYIYGTPSLSTDANLLDIHYQWNAKGTGGDSKGKLLATRNFDDGRCYQDNTQEIATQRRQKYPKATEQPMGDNLWCQNDLALPVDLPAGKPYTLIWVWDWPTMDRANVTVPPSSAPGAAPGENGAKVKIPELYTTVIDIDVVDPCDDILGEVKGPTCTKGGGGSRQTFVVTETDLNKAAIQEQVKNMFIVDVSALIDVGSKNNSSASSVSSQASSSSAGGGRVKTTTTYGGVTVTTATRPTGTDRGARVKTTTVYDSTTVTTVTIYPSTASANPGVATASSIVTKTVVAYSTTVTSTISRSPSSLPSGSAAASISTSSAGSQGSSGSPTVTGFLKDAKPTAAKKGRRAAGQWGFGRGHA
ncbi:hypothetical protein BR93DRAFT_938603 [Coniochaeta sp. PMI_546]|nr:hypothetical protein BR93DRAFT_938603 [Coniochaeta sp. PMI_546]